MVDVYIQSFFINSIQNSIDYISVTKTDDKKEFIYTITISDIPTTEKIISLLKQETDGFDHQKITIKKVNRSKEIL